LVITSSKGPKNSVVINEYRKQLLYEELVRTIEYLTQ
jgi:hypothetical protein